MNTENIKEAQIVPDPKKDNKFKKFENNKFFKFIKDNIWLLSGLIVGFILYFYFFSEPQSTKEKKVIKQEQVVTPTTSSSLTAPTTACPDQLDELDRENARLQKEIENAKLRKELAKVVISCESEKKITRSKSKVVYRTKVIKIPVACNSCGLAPVEPGQTRITPQGGGKDRSAYLELWSPDHKEHKRFDFSKSGYQEMVSAAPGFAERTNERNQAIGDSRRVDVTWFTNQVKASHDPNALPD